MSSHASTDPAQKIEICPGDLICRRDSEQDMIILDLYAGRDDRDCVDVLHVGLAINVTRKKCRYMHVFHTQYAINVSKIE